MEQVFKLSKQQILSMEQHLSTGKKIEIIPTNEGVKFFILNRKEMK